MIQQKVYIQNLICKCVPCPHDGILNLNWNVSVILILTGRIDCYECPLYWSDIIYPRSAALSDCGAGEAVCLILALSKKLNSTPSILRQHQPCTYWHNAFKSPGTCLQIIYLKWSNYLSLKLWSMPDSANIIWQTQTENILKPNNISNHHHFMTIHPFLHDLALSAISVFMLHAAQQYKTLLYQLLRCLCKNISQASIYLQGVTVTTEKHKLKQLISSSDFRSFQQKMFAITSTNCAFSHKDNCWDKKHQLLLEMIN